ncbi:xanthine phosphoribosyltransferase [Paenibacillus oceani]|jgi:xanthine phosphoribosyltransferase|uniref:Xanthine phosphoribosyltransferase n=1 Tax=Paenibacillus oceani TaxID=2772510 RepID=A0A927H2J0_9BACL|nr:xanthine phosphoribosyltransferase [Paenibacillus oceani]MBD2865413.1 xanthine phosphoribosyltransferase [Paenibacillus oceani]MDF2660544.1 xanthine phosphoribosyltransferase [Paenibacillus sp.]
MDILKQRIAEQGVILSNQTLQLDALLNHQVDPKLIMEIGQEFARRFKEERITKVLTIESSGITVAFATALELGVPLVFARRKKTLTTDGEVWCERVPSFTKGIVTDILISKNVLSSQDRVLLIDDIIANGDAARGLIRILERAEAELAGVGVVVEKSFQAGARLIREMGYRFESIVAIKSLEGGAVQFESQ